MVSPKEQYEAYPYPERNPADERKRLIVGSPSMPIEMDHFLWGGARDWSKKLRVLVAGGGTGDALIQLAQMMTTAGRPYEITYIDLSLASRKIAEARAAERGLTDITFLSGDLCDAPDLGVFDYIDCCGVLHHLPEPSKGFAALRSALAAGGGMGFMVYAPYGRSGVYPLQAAFGALFADLPPKERLHAAKQAFEKLPDAHPFKRNPGLVDHRQSDAGFYDLLLHSQDQAFDVARLVDVLDETGWHLMSFSTPALYDPSRIAPVSDGMGWVARMAAAEQLRGTLKTHVAYVVPKNEERTVATGANRAMIPHLKGVKAGQLAKAVAQGKPIPVTTGGETVLLNLPPKAAPLIAAIDGRKSLTQIANAAGMDVFGFGALWSKVEEPLIEWGLLLYSRFTV